MGRLSSRRVWLAGGALIAALIAALSWFTLIGPGLSSAHDLQDQAAATAIQNDALSAKAASLKAKSARVSTYTSSLRTRLAGLPYGSGLPAFTRQVNAQARAHRVTLSSVTVGGVTPVVATAAAPSPGSTTGFATGSTTGAGTTGTTTSSTPSAAGSLFSIQVSLQSTGSLVDQLAFLGAVRTIGPRRALVTSTQVAPGSGTSSRAGSRAGTVSLDSTSSLTTQVTIFAAPRTPDQVKQLKKLLAGDLDG